MLSNYFTFTYILMLSSLASALPVFENKRVVTRVHTASETNTVTDYYSTTTEIVVAPTVQLIISDEFTFTTTLIPEGIDPTAQPTTTITIRQNNVQKPTLAASFITKSVPEATVVPTTSSTTITQEPPTTSSSDVAPTTLATSTEERKTTTLTPLPTEVINQVHSSIATTPTTSIVGQTTSTTATTSTSSTSVPTFAAGLLTKPPVAIAYSPYNNDGTCKSATAVYNDLAILKARGISRIRVYGIDCGSLETILPTCKQMGIKVNQGLWISPEGVDSINDAVNSLVTYGQTNGWDIFEFITVGNEAIIAGYCSVSDLINKIAAVKSQLNAAGYYGQITTSEPPVSFESHPELCQAQIDFIGINPHSYFDVNSSAKTSGSFVKGQLELVQKICGTKNVFVTETGYPSAGIQNGGNIPSIENQLIAVQSIIDEMGGDITILTFNNDYWKQPGPYGVEQSFGIIDILP